MGRQSARIYFNGQDHKEMVTWDGSQYVYHDKAYIWNGSEFELVWEKLYGLRLLYETNLELRPVSSENNRYLYFTEGGDASVIYRIKVNDEQPEKEEQYTSQTYNSFNAPISSRGFAIYNEAPYYIGTSYHYRILNLEDGTYYTQDEIFNAYDYLTLPEVVPPPTYGNQEVTPAESGVNHNYASILSRYQAGATYQPWNFVYFVAPTGISALALANREGTGTLIDGWVWDIGRLNDGTARGLLPRFLGLSPDRTKFRIWEYGYGELYSVTVLDDPPFSPCNDAQGYGVTRDEVLPILDSSNRLWFVKPQTDSIEYEDTEIDVSDYRVWDIDPSHKYVLDFEYTTSWTGIAKIIDIKTGRTIVNISDELHDILISSVKFVGHKCLLVTGYINDYISLVNFRYRLYKWR